VAPPEIFKKIWGARTEQKFPLLACFPFLFGPLAVGEGCLKSITPILVWWGLLF